MSFLWRTFFWDSTPECGSRDPGHGDFPNLNWGTEADRSLLFESRIAFYKGTDTDTGPLSTCPNVAFTRRARCGMAPTEFSYYVASLAYGHVAQE